MWTLVFGSMFVDNFNGNIIDSVKALSEQAG